MNTSGEAADQIVRIALNGTEEILKLTGKGAIQIATLLYAVYKGEKKTKGRERLTNMLRSGKPLRVYTFETKDLAKFKECAKQYGIVYTVLKEKDKSDGVFDVFVHADDENKMARIIERFNLTKVNTESLRAEIIKEKESQISSVEKGGDDKTESAGQQTSQDKYEDDVVDKLYTPKKKEEQEIENPIMARTENNIPTKKQIALTTAEQYSEEDVIKSLFGPRSNESKPTSPKKYKDGRISVMETIEKIKKETAKEKLAQKNEMAKMPIPKTNKER